MFLKKEKILGMKFILRKKCNSTMSFKMPSSPQIKLFQKELSFNFTSKHKPHNMEVWNS